MQSAENHPAQCCEVAEALAMQGQAVVSPQVKQKEKKEWSWPWPNETLGFSNLQRVVARSFARVSNHIKPTDRLDTSS